MIWLHRSPVREILRGIRADAFEILTDQYGDLDESSTTFILRRIGMEDITIIRTIRDECGVITIFYTSPTDYWMSGLEMRIVHREARISVEKKLRAKEKREKRERDAILSAMGESCLANRRVEIISALQDR